MKKFLRFSLLSLLFSLAFFGQTSMTSAQEGEEIVMSDTRYAAVSVSDAVAFDFADKSGLSVSATVKNLFPEKRVYRAAVEFRGVSEENKGELFIWRYPEEFAFDGNQEQPISFIVSNPSILNGKYRLTLGMNDRRGNVVAMISLGEKEFAHAGRLQLKDCSIMGENNGMIQTESVSGVIGTCQVMWDGAKDELVRLVTQVTESRYGVPRMIGQSDTISKTDDFVAGEVVVSENLEPGTYQVEIVPVAAAGHMIGIPIRKTIVVTGKGGKLIGVTRFEGGKAWAAGETVPVAVQFSVYDTSKYDLLLELVSQAGSCATPIRAGVEGQTNFYEGEFAVNTNCANPEVRATLSADGKQIDQWVRTDDMPMKTVVEDKKMVGIPRWVLFGGAGLSLLILGYFFMKRRTRARRMMTLLFPLFTSVIFFGINIDQAKAGSTVFGLTCLCGGIDSNATYMFSTDKNTYAPGETITVMLEFAPGDLAWMYTSTFSPYVRLGINGGSFTSDLVPGSYDSLTATQFPPVIMMSRPAPLTTGPFNLSFNVGLNGYIIPPDKNIPLTVAISSPAPTVTLDPFSPSTINAGQSATISLSTTNATSCSGDPGSLWTGNLGATSFSNVSTGPMNTPGTYTQRVTCTGPGGSTQSAQRTLTVNAVVATGSFTSTPSCTIPAGGAGCNVTIDWTTSNTSTATLTNCGDVYLDSISSGPRSTPNVYIPYNNGCYRIHNGGTSGPVLAQNTLSSSCASGTSWNGSSCQAAGVNGVCGSANGRTYNVSASVIPVSDRCSSGTYDIGQWGTDGGAWYSTSTFDGNGIQQSYSGQLGYYQGRTWECDGSGGGITRGCRLYYQPQCGSNHGATLSSVPGSSSYFEKQALCSIGVAGPITTNATTYTWRCDNGAGPTAFCSANRSGGGSAPTATITATGPVALAPQSWWQKALSWITGNAHASGSNAYITTSQNARIDWSVTNLGSGSCTVSGPAVNSSSSSGNRTLSGGTLGAGTHTYTMTCSNTSGTDTDSVQVIVSAPSGGGGCCSTGTPGNTPSNLAAFPGSCGSGQIQLSWSPVSGANGYEIRDGASIIASTTATSYIHSGLSAGSSHSYSVRAYGPNGNSSYSNIVSQSAPNSCIAVCGNSITEGGEQCDTGGARGACPATCSNSCTTNTCAVVMDGVCGPAHMGSYATSPPASSLCSSGTASVVNNNGDYWTWSCESMSGGATPACWAAVSGGGGGGSCGNWVTDPGEQCDNGIVNGACPNSCSNSCTLNTCTGTPPQCALNHYACSSGTSTGGFDAGTFWSWRCQAPGYTDANCMEMKAASGSISVTSCTIPVGAGQCGILASWTTSGASNPRLDALTGSPQQVYGPTGNNVSIQLPYGNQLLTLWDVNTLVTYDTEMVNIACAPGGTWSVVGNRCEPSPIVDLTINGSTGPVSVAPGDALAIDWTVSGATSCTASGKWSGAKSTTGGTENTTAAVPSGDYTLTCINGAGMSTVKQVTVNLACTASTTPWSACGPPCSGGNGTRSRTVTTGACVVTTQTESCTTNTCRDLNWKEVGQ